MAPITQLNWLVEVIFAMQIESIAPQSSLWGSELLLLFSQSSLFLCFFSKRKEPTKHQHVYVTSIEGVTHGQHSWCRLCRQKTPLATDPDQGLHTPFVTPELRWITVEQCCFALWWQNSQQTCSQNIIYSKKKTSFRKHLFIKIMKLVNNVVCSLAAFKLTHLIQIGTMAFIEWALSTCIAQIKLNHSFSFVCVFVV